jgi:hypothetical protein
MIEIKVEVLPYNSLLTNVFNSLFKAGLRKEACDFVFLYEGETLISFNEAIARIRIGIKVKIAELQLLDLEELQALLNYKIAHNQDDDFSACLDERIQNIKHS